MRKRKDEGTGPKVTDWPIWQDHPWQDIIRAGETSLEVRKTAIDGKEVCAFVVPDREHGVRHVDFELPFTGSIRPILVNLGMGLPYGGLMSA